MSCVKGITWLISAKGIKVKSAGQTGQTGRSCCWMFLLQAISLQPNCPLSLIICVFTMLETSHSDEPARASFHSKGGVSWVMFPITINVTTETQYNEMRFGQNFDRMCERGDRLCGLVVGVPGSRQRSRVRFPGLPDFSE
jgi:hypothetical protein